MSSFLDFVAGLDGRPAVAGVVAGVAGAKSGAATPQPTDDGAVAGVAGVAGEKTNVEMKLGKPIPRKRRWLFLGHCPFTRSMLERGAELWGEPLDNDDLTEIERGKHYLFERRQSGLQDLLYQWADDNPGRMAVLLAEFYPESTESSTNNDSGPSR